MLTWQLAGGFPMTLNLDIQLNGPEGLTKRDFKEIGRQTFEAAGKRHRRRNLYHHFERRATKRYGYAKRKGESNPRKGGTYSARKLRLFGHVKPLVWSGELRRLTLNGIQAVKAVTRHGGEFVAKIKLPAKANFRNPNSKAHPLRELQSFHQSEIEDLDKFVEEDFDRRISRRR